MQPSTSPPRFFTFAGGPTGTWTVRAQTTIRGEDLPQVERIDVLAGPQSPQNARWLLKGITSNERYVVRTEKQELLTKQQGLGRVEATVAAMIPMRKKPEWWALTQDERRDIFEEQSRHIAIGMRYLPPIARRLHHCRDLTETAPFDFVTWFEYAPNDEADFEALLRELRNSPEWQYVDREIDFRLFKNTA